MISFIRSHLKKEEGMGTVEIVIIIAVLVGIALIFRDAIIDFVTGIMENVFGDGTIPQDIDSGLIRDQNRIN
ncbi:MAG: Flp1 family type IVb pilin [Acetivibrionales bacterium]